MNYVIEKIKEKKINELKAKYIKTQENEQGKEFYEKCSFSLTELTNSFRNYTIDTSNYEPKKLNYIEIETKSDRSF